MVEEVHVSTALCAALDAVDDAAILLSPGDTGEILHVNAAFERATGYDRPAAVGRSGERT